MPPPPLVLELTNASKSVRKVRALRVLPPPKRLAAIERARAISASLRKRAGWNVTSAHVQQGWTIVLDGTRYPIVSVASAFLEGPRAPGFVFSVSILSPASKHLVPRVWLRGVRKRLGDDYASDDDTQLYRVLRGTTDPRIILGELRRIAAAIEGKTPPDPAGARRRREVAAHHDDRDNVWTILGALGRTGWRVSSIGQALQRQVQHDRCRWHVSTSLNVLVDSMVNRPGFAGMVGSWSRSGEQRKRRNPISNASDILRKTGHRRLLESTHYQRWHWDLTLRAATEEIELLERVMRLICDDEERI